MMYRDAELEAKRQIVTYLQDLSRMTVEIAGVLVKLIKYLKEGRHKDLPDIYLKIKEIDTSVANLQKTIMGEIIKLRPFLSNSVAIYDLVAKVGDVVDAIDGAAYRIAYLRLDTLSKWELELLEKIGKTVYQEIDAFREAMYLLGYNPESLSTAIHSIFELEKEVDTIHREALSKVFTKETRAANLVKWIEVSERLETAADNVEKVADILVTFLIG